MFNTTGFEDRLTIASQCPIEVYAPAVHPSEDAGENTGDWWPYRRQTVDEATEAASDRCLKFVVDIDGYTDAISTTDLYRRADEFNATYALQRPMPGMPGRNPSTTAALTHETTDYSNWKTTPILPISNPHGRTREFLEEATPSIARNAAFALVGLRHAPPAEQVRALREFRDAAGAAATVFMVDIVPTAPLVRALAEDPHLVDAILLSEDARRLVSTTEPSHFDTTSPHGEALLQGGTSPLTRIAAQVSYILSPLCSEAGVDTAIAESAIPDSPKDTSIPTTAVELIEQQA